MRRLLFLAVAAVFSLQGGGALSVDPIEFKEETDEMRRIQGAVEDLIFGQVQSPSSRNIDDLLEFFENPEVVKNFQSHYEAGLLPKTKVFTIRDPAIREETISIFELFFYAKDFDSLSQVAKWLHGVMNYEQYTYALAVALVHREDIVVKLPLWTEVFPNYFIPNSFIEEWKEEYREDARPSAEPVLVGTTKSPNSPSYFTEDPGLALMYYNWQIEFPAWMDYAKYGLAKWEKRPELYYGFHYHLLNSFIIMASSNMGDEFQKDWSNTSVWNWLNLQFGLDHAFVNSVKQPLIQKHIPAEYVDPIVETEDKKWSLENELIVGPKQKGMPFMDASVSVLTNTIFNLTDSVNRDYYGSYFDTLVNFLARYGSDPEKDGGALAGYPMTAVKDPHFYTAVEKATFIIFMASQQIKHQQPMVHGMGFGSIEIGEVKTVYRPYYIDATRYITKSASRDRFKAKIMVADHTPFVVTLNIFNTGDKPQEVLVRLLIQANFDTRRASPPWTMATRTQMFTGFSLEVDRFPVIVPPGNHTIVRDLKDSTIYSNEGKGDVQCGVPYRLMLPQGKRGVASMVMIASMTPYESGTEDSVLGREEEYWKKSALCGSRRYDDGNLLGYPQCNLAYGLGHMERNLVVLKEFSIGSQE